MSVHMNALGVKARHLLFQRISAPILMVFAVVLAVATMVIGPYHVDFLQVWEIVLHHLVGTKTDATVAEDLVVWTIRFPRAIAAFVVGAALAISGAVMQGMFRNPLADPGLIGVSAGASVMAAFGIVLAGIWFREMSEVLGFWLIPILAFGGGTIVTFFIYSVSLTPRGVSVVTMLLAGIAINAMVGAISGTLTFVATDTQLRDMAFWSLGSLGGVSWKFMPVIAVLAVVCVIMTRLAKGLNALLLGEAEARHVGIDTRLLNRRCIVLTALAVGFSVSVAGPIAFVGIVVPHLLRLVMGPDHRFLLPNCIMLGGCLMLFSDILAKTLFPPAELPIGIITASVGAPFFLYILIKNKKSMGL